MGLAAVGCGVGMFLFGYTMQVGSPAPLCAFFQGVQMFGVLIGIFSTLSYGLDAFRSQSNEIFIMNMLFKVSQRSKSLIVLSNLSSELHVLRSEQLRQPMGHFIRT